jgi:hypothetical protein
MAEIAEIGYVTARQPGEWIVAPLSNFVNMQIAWTHKTKTAALRLFLFCESILDPGSTLGFVVDRTRGAVGAHSQLR